MRRKPMRPRMPRARLNLESLESRLAPAGNLQIVPTSPPILVNALDQPLAGPPVVGQRVFLRASWISSGLAGNDTYTVRVTVDGYPTVSTTLNALATSVRQRPHAVRVVGENEFWDIQDSDRKVEWNEEFEVVASGGVPEMRVLQNSRIVVNQRVTPLDLGSVSVVGPAPTMQFTINNHGAAPRNTSNLVLPIGYSLVGAFPTSVAAGGNATFTIRLDAANPGLKFGEVRFTSNDSDEGTFTFLITGIVNGTPPVNTAPTLDTPPGPQLPNVTEDTPNPGGATVASLLGAALTDPDTGAQIGVAVTGVTGTGIWQFSLNGTTWINLGTPSQTAVRLLRGTDRVRFLPGMSNTDPATITYAATGTGLWEFSLDGGTTWQSLGSVTATAALLLRDTDLVRFTPTAGFQGAATLKG